MPPDAMKAAEILRTWSGAVDIVMTEKVFNGNSYSFRYNELRR